jgi:BirA family biotin operon repressor/biotin-[acetyl-CoA-carboxylase] ligase
MDLDRIIAGTFIRQGEHHSVIGSTNDRARERALEQDLELPLLVLADQQTAGRGRGANRWWTGQGSLALSLLLDPAQLGIERQHCGLLSLATALASVETAAALLPSEVVGVHWPNDVYVGPRKLAGILVEALPGGRHIVGIGMNINNSLRDSPHEVQGIAVSLRDITGREYPIPSLLAALLEHIEAMFRLLADEPDEIGRQCDRCCLQHEQVLTIDNGPATATGRCLGIAHDGALLLNTERGTERFYAGVLRRGDWGRAGLR